MADLFTTAEQACRLRDIGLDRVESNNYDWVKLARGVAIQLAASRGEVCSDDVLKIVPRPDNVNPNAVGSIFRDKRLRWTGKMKPSEKLSRHAGLQRIWEYVETTA